MCDNLIRLSAILPPWLCVLDCPISNKRKSAWISKHSNLAQCHNTERRSRPSNPMQPVLKQRRGVDTQKVLGIRVFGRHNQSFVNSHLLGRILLSILGTLANILLRCFPKLLHCLQRPFLLLLSASPVPVSLLPPEAPRCLEKTVPVNSLQIESSWTKAPALELSLPWLHSPPGFNYLFTSPRIQWNKSLEMEFDLSRGGIWV